MDSADVDRKTRARITGVRGETYAYWYLRRSGYAMIAKNFRVPWMHGEIDLVGYDRDVLVFIEVKTQDMTVRTATRPEFFVDWRKRRTVRRMARAFLRVYHLENPPVSYRFDLVAVEFYPSAKPVVRVHKGVFRGVNQGLLSIPQTSSSKLDVALTLARCRRAMRWAFWSSIAFVRSVRGKTSALFRL